MVSFGSACASAAAVEKVLVYTNSCMSSELFFVIFLEKPCNEHATCTSLAAADLPNPP